MKKSMIAAGAASVALAATPIVGAFAAVSPTVLSQTDTLMITIGSACSIGYDTDDSATGSTIEIEGVAHTPGDGTWGNDPTATAGTATHPDTLSATMLNGTSSDNLGKTTLGIYCNNANGYTITTSGAGALADANTTTPVADTIPVNDSYSASSTGWSYVVAAGTAGTQRGEVKNGHTAKAKPDAGGVSPMANEVIAGSPSTTPKTTSNDGDFFTITYGAGINDSLAAATYKGQITYTLAAL